MVHVKLSVETKSAFSPRVHAVAQVLVATRPRSTTAAAATAAAFLAGLPLFIPGVFRQGQVQAHPSVDGRCRRGHDRVPRKQILFLFCFVCCSRVSGTAFGHAICDRVASVWRRSRGPRGYRVRGDAAAVPCAGHRAPQRNVNRVAEFGGVWYPIRIIRLLPYCTARSLRGGPPT